ncbi:MAG: DUF721 domain-containing protein [Deltaproteobacteria bacterium]|nr:DUF721 domain-containing protein [Deltaproteobacteria bacterium]
MSKKTPPPSSLDTILRGVLQDMPAANRTGMLKLRAAWQKAVGQRIAAKASPEMVRNQVLMVHVENSVWMQELHFMKDQILEKLNARIDTAALRDIRFKIGQVGKKAPARKKAPLLPLDADDQKKIDRDAAAIEDGELRDSFKSFMATHLKSTKRTDGET